MANPPIVFYWLSDSDNLPDQMGTSAEIGYWKTDDMMEGSEIDGGRAHPYPEHKFLDSMYYGLNKHAYDKWRVASFGHADVEVGDEVRFRHPNGNTYLFTLQQQGPYKKSFEFVEWWPTSDTLQETEIAPTEQTPNLPLPEPVPIVGLFEQKGKVDWTAFHAQQKIQEAVQKGMAQAKRMFREWPIGYKLNYRLNEKDESIEFFWEEDPTAIVAQKIKLWLKLANELDQEGLFKEADLLDNILMKKMAFTSVQDLSESLRRIITHLMQRYKPEKQYKFRQSIQKSLLKLNPLELSSKRSNPASAIGAAINVVKNVLINQPPAVVGAVLADLQRLL